MHCELRVEKENEIIKLRVGVRHIELVLALSNTCSVVEKHKYT